MVLIFVLKTIAGVEIENRWNNIVHHENGAGSSIIDNNVGETPNLPEYTSMAEITNSPYPTYIAGEMDSTEATDIPRKTNEPKMEAVNFTGNEIKGELYGTDDIEIKYTALKTGKYRFDFNIDDANKEYYFYILDSKNEKIEGGYSHDMGINATLESGMEYKLVIEHSDEDTYVEYGILIHSPKDIENIAERTIEGEISYVGQENCYIYKAPKTGKYRFDFIIDDVNKEYGFYIYDSKNAELLYKRSADKGETIELNKDCIYKIEIVQITDFPNYTINIGVPNETRNVENNKIKGKIEYIGQENKYIYEAPQNGKYRIDFGINDVNYAYTFVLLDSKKEEIINADSSYKGESVELIKGEKYEIIIKQKNDLVNYNVKIHVPNEPILLIDNIIKGKIEYIDQQNIYYYIAPETCKYLFHFNINNVDYRYKICLYDSKNELLFEQYSYCEPYEMKLKKNKKYKICVYYLDEYPEYNINIEKLE